MQRRMSAEMNAVIFDLDGTLIDTAPDIINALNKTLADLNLASIDDATGRSLIGNGARKLVEDGLRESGLAVTNTILNDAYTRFINFYGEATAVLSRLYPGVQDALDTLAQRGFSMGVCTNKPEALSIDVLKSFNLSKYFRAVVGGDTLPEKKPAGEHVLETARRTAPKYSRAILIGDSQTDISAARNAGIPVIAVDYGYRTIPVTELGANVVITNMRELPPLLEHFLESA